MKKLNLISIITVLSLASCDHYKNHQEPYAECEGKISSTLNSSSVSSITPLKKPNKKEEILIAKDCK